MKLLLFNEYTSIRGGVDNVVDLEYQLLRKTKNQVQIVRYNNRYLLESGIWIKIKIFYESLTGDLLLKKVQHLINRYRPDIIHIHNIYQLFRSPLWNKINPQGGKIVLHLHNFYPFCLNSFFYNGKDYCLRCYSKNSWLPGILRRCYNNSLLQSLYVSLNRSRPVEWIRNCKKVSCFIAVSQFVADKYVSLGIPSSKISVLFNPVDADMKYEEKGKDYVLYIGNIRKEKGIYYLLEAARSNRHISFYIAGIGRELTKIKRKYRNLENVSFKGFVDGEEKRKLLLDARFLLVPSLCEETFGLVVLEAYSVGTPVLTTGKGALKELVKEGITGRNIIEKNISSEINNFWNETGKKTDYYKENCVEYSKHFSVQNHVDTLQTIYNSLMIYA